MIRVDRNRIPRPEIFGPNGPAEKELALAHDFFSPTDPKSRQQRFDFKIYRQRSVKEALTELFYGKCAYCEAKIGMSAPIDVELFRPKASVVESPDHPGYWWLAMVWENLLASCADCNRVRLHEGVRTGKANRFPLVDEKKRAFTPDAKLSDEEPLLLDPCNDYPEQHLVFEVTGRVVSDTERGNTTIAVVGLNRPFLVEARQRAADVVSNYFKLYDKNSSDGLRRELLDLFKGLTEPQQEFAGLKRQLITSFLSNNKDLANEHAFLESTTKEEAFTVNVSEERHQRAIETHSRYEHDQSSYSLDDEQGREKYRGQRRMIERIEIKDVKAIQSLVLDLTQVSGRTPWLMLLGENATGKSTVLQTASLALLGARAFVNLTKIRAIHPAEFIRYNSKLGSVSVKVSGFPKPHKLVFKSDRVTFKSPTGETTTIVFKETGETVIKGHGWAPQMLLLAYGATKLLPRGSSSDSATWSDKEYCRVDNLFDPFVPLIDAEKWLLSLDDERFDDTALILKDLLALSDDAQLAKENGRVVVVAYGSKVPLRQLSDGYQSVVAMTVDILEVALRLWPNLLEAEGIVLLDEVGAHLHPTWKMKIVASLRKALPAMQFVATTHDPLCLRGLGKGEVAVMQRGEDSQVTALTNLPSPGDFRIDQLLTSDFFGLNSLDDPEVEALFDEYYALLGMSSRDEDQETRLAQLRQDLKDRRHFGTTKRESLMYEAVDRLMAQHRKQPTIPIADLKEAAVDEVAKIWNATAGTGDGAQ